MYDSNGRVWLRRVLGLLLAALARVSLIAAFAFGIGAAPAYASFGAIPPSNYNAGGFTATTANLAASAYLKSSHSPEFWCLNYAGSPFSGSTCTQDATTLTSTTSLQTLSYQRYTQGSGAYVGNSTMNVTYSPQSASCPAGATLSGSTCTCSSGYVQNVTNDGCNAPSSAEQICRDNAVLENSTFSSTGAEQTALSGSVTTGTKCSSQINGIPAGKGCAFTRDLTGGYRETATSPWYVTYRDHFTGDACTISGTATPTTPAASAATANAAPSPCPAGKIPGTATMGGTTVTVCSDPIQKSSGAETTSVKKNAGTSSETTDTKAEETICGKSSCNTTTTVTTTNNVGTVTGTATTVTVTGKSEYCAANKANGACAGEVPTGCESGIETAGCVELGDPKNGVLPTQSVAVSTPGMDGMSGFSIGSSCPADLTTTVRGRTLHFSFATACSTAPMAKPFVVFAAACTALLMVYAALTTKAG